VVGQGGDQQEDHGDGTDQARDRLQSVRAAARIRSTHGLLFPMPWASGTCLGRMIVTGGAGIDALLRDIVNVHWPAADST
jgi:hypothetical protein